MDKNDKSIYIALFIVLIIIIILIILAVVFKDELFDTGKNLAKKDSATLTKKGFGIYQKAYESPCITLNGKCNTAGTKYISEYCYPNPASGNGCIDENGNQTFNSRSRTEVCIPTCRSYVLQEKTESNICQYDNPFNSPNYSCIPTNAQSYEYRRYLCVKNDGIGDNTCTYKCGSAGIDSAGIKGDVDPSKESYIPYCQQPKNFGKTITINSIPWNTINSLGSNGFTLSKGYNIKNIILSNGSVDPNNFKITPPYPPWSNNPSSTITYEQLKELDTTLTVYQNCIATDNKPFCDNYYYVRPTEIGADTTIQNLPELCQLDAGYEGLAQCFYHPWYDGPGEGTGAGASGLNFINPYTKITKGLTGSAFTWQGIGNYGYFATPLVCETSVKPLNPDPGNTGEYIIPTSDGICMNLSNIPQQCSNDFTNIFAVTPSNNIANIIKEYDTGTYNPSVNSSYPATLNSTNYICNLTYANGISTHQPGCTQTCQYLPTPEEIDFSAPDSNGVHIDANLQVILGNYLNFNIELGGKGYFLSTQNYPCKNDSNQGVPLGACNGGGTAYLPVPCTFIYNGGTGINAGNYWNKIGCDQESIELATEMKIIVSPAMVYNEYVSGSTGTAILCDLYAQVNGIFGYLSVGSTSSPYTINDNFDSINNYLGSTGDYANVIASLYFYNPSDTLYFNPLPKGQSIPRVTGGPNIPYFILEYSGGSYSVKSSNFVDPAIATYDGVNYTPTALSSFSFTTSTSAIPGTPYFTTQGFFSPIIKQEGIYAGDDVTRTITLQRNNKCYTYNMCKNNQTPGVICYPETCNLFNIYNPDYCN